MTSRRAGNRAAGSLPRAAARWLRALAVTLPLGLDPQIQVGGVAPLAPFPPELVSDREALGAIGVLWDEGRVCVALGLRRDGHTLAVRHSLWRPSGAPSQGTVLALERQPETSAAGDFERWSGCARAVEPRDGATLSTLLVGTDGAERRRIDLPSAEPGTWAWRVIHPLESTIEVLPVAGDGAAGAVESDRRHGG